MDFKNKTKEWFDENFDNLSREEKRLCKVLDYKTDFLVQEQDISVVEDLAKLFEYEVIYVNLFGLDDLTGNPVACHTDDGILYSNYHVAWTDPIDENPDKQYLVIFNIDNVDDSFVNTLKSIIEKHVVEGRKYDNMLVCVHCSDKERVIKSTTISVVREIKLTV